MLHVDRLKTEENREISSFWFFPLNRVKQLEIYLSNIQEKSWNPVSHYIENKDATYAVNFANVPYNPEW